MKTSILYLLPLLFALFACETQTKENLISQDYYFLDIRALEDNNTVLINNSTVSIANIASYLEMRDYPIKTEGRIIISDDTPISLLNSIFKSLVSTIKSEGEFKTLIYTAEEIAKLGTEIMHIDILNETELLFEGNLIHIDDLDIALKSFKITTKIEIPTYIVGINEDAPFSTLHRLQEKIRDFQAI